MTDSVTSADETNLAFLLDTLDSIWGRWRDLEEALTGIRLEAEEESAVVAEGHWRNLEYRPNNHHTSFL